MERATRLRSLWSWLPAFRAVAETEHLPTASEALRVSASSLSRTIRLLEEDLGTRLFDRVGRQLVLNAAGRELLGRVRLAMRSVDEALVVLGSGRLVGNVTVHAPGPFASAWVVPALRALTRRHPELVPTLTSRPLPSVGDALRRGAIDVAVLDDPEHLPDLALVELTELPHTVCCGPGHPLFDQPTADLEAIAEHDFVVPCPLEGGPVPDRWPPARARRIALYVTHTQVAIDACASGAFLAVLPWPVAERAGLRRLPVPEVTGSTLCAMHRPSLDAGGRTEEVVRALVEATR